MSEEKIILAKDVVLTKKMVEVYDNVIDGKNGPRMLLCSTTTEEAMREYIATHTICTRCGKPAKKPYLTCKECQRDKNTELFNNYEEKEWTEGMAFSIAYDEYYLNWDEIFDKLADQLESDPETTIEDMRLIIAKPVYPRQIDRDFFGDELPEDMDELPQKILDAMKAFNDVIETCEPLSYYGYHHDKKRVKITEGVLRQFDELKEEIFGNDEEDYLGCI